LRKSISAAPVPQRFAVRSIKGRHRVAFHRFIPPGSAEDFVLLVEPLETSRNFVPEVFEITVRWDRRLIAEHRLDDFLVARPATRWRQWAAVVSYGSDGLEDPRQGAGDR